jgi:hypothetical protein
MLAVLVSLLVLGACGGGDDGGGDLFAPGTTSGDGGGGTEPAPPGEGSDAEGGTLGGVSAADRATLSTDPGTAYADVDGEHIAYASAGSIGYTCEVGPDRLLVNFQTPEGQDLSIQAGLDETGWRGQFTFRAAGQGNTQYSVVLAQASGTLGAGDGVMSYEGTADRIVDFDVTNAESVDVEVAVNCTVAGDGREPEAVLGGATYVFPLSGAQSVTCAVTPDDVDITINRLATENLQLSIDMRGGPGDWIGAVFVITPDGEYTATLSGDAPGLTIDGRTVTYEGPIESDGGETEASVSVTCP